MRPTPKLIDPSLLNKVNEVYIAKTQQNNSILVWLFNNIGYYFKQNVIFSFVFIILVGFLLYRYVENIKRKNKILKNLNSDKPIEIKLEKPIDYNNKPQQQQQIQIQANNGEVLSEISINLKQDFDKEIENNLKIVNNPNQNQPLNPNLDRIQSMNSKADPQQQQQVQYQLHQQQQQEQQLEQQYPEQQQQFQTQNEPSNVLHKSNIPVVEPQCGIAKQIQEAQQPTCGFQGKKNSYLETSEVSKKVEKKKDKHRKDKHRKDKHKKDKHKKDKHKKERKHNKKRDKSKRKSTRKNKKSKKSRRDPHEEEILNIFEREMAITHGSIDRERTNKESKFKPLFLEELEQNGPMAYSTFSDNFMSF